MSLRKAAAASSRPAVTTSISRLSSSTGEALSPRGSLRPASPSSQTSSPRGSISAVKSAAAAKLAALEAQAGKATSRSLAVGSALDSSMQAMQAAKQSLLSMHHNDLKLELISQSVQEVLAGKVRRSYDRFATLHMSVRLHCNPASGYSWLVVLTCKLAAPVEWCNH